VYPCAYTSFPLFFSRNGFLACHPVRNYNQCNQSSQSFLISGIISKQLSGIALTWLIAGISPIVVLPVRVPYFDYQLIDPRKRKRQRIVRPMTGVS
jgi:hypothetical protein